MWKICGIPTQIHSYSAYTIVSNSCWIWQQISSFILIVSVFFLLLYIFLIAVLVFAYTIENIFNGMCETRALRFSHFQNWIFIPFCQIAFLVWLTRADIEAHTTNDGWKANRHKISQSITNTHVHIIHTNILVCLYSFAFEFFSTQHTETIYIAVSVWQFV